MALSPFEILNTPLNEVFDIYVNCIIHDKKEKGGTGDKSQDVWVTSANANWH